MRYNKWSGLKLNGLIAGKQGVAFVEDKLKDPSIKPYCARLCEICEELSTASAEDLTPLLSPPIQVRVVGHVSKADSQQGYAQYFLITTIGDINQGGTLIYAPVLRQYGKAKDAPRHPSPVFLSCGWMASVPPFGHSGPTLTRIANICEALVCEKVPSRPWNHRVSQGSIYPTGTRFHIPDFSFISGTLVTKRQPGPGAPLRV